MLCRNRFLLLEDADRTRVLDDVRARGGAGRTLAEQVERHAGGVGDGREARRRVHRRRRIADDLPSRVGGDVHRVDEVLLIDVLAQSLFLGFEGLVPGFACFQE